MKFFSRIKNYSSRGDTLVEVLISIAIITLVVALGYTIANRSLQSGTSASQRTQALSLAQGQVEQLVNAVNSNNIDAYKLKTAFCVDPTTAKPVDATSGTTCTQFKYQNNDTPYNVNVSYDDSSGIFTVKATWTQSSGAKSQAGSEGQLTLYYKAPGLFTGTDVCKNFDGIQLTIPSGYKSDGNGNCIKIGCGSVSDPCNTPPPQTNPDSSPPVCTINQVIPNPPNDPGVWGDCTGGHCGSPETPTTSTTDPGCQTPGHSTTTVSCIGSPPCACTVSISDWNGAGYDQHVEHYWNCLDQQPPPDTVWPPPNDPSQVGTGGCPNGEYGVANSPDGCHPYTPCPVGYENPPSCTPIPTVNPQTGNTTCPTGYTWDGSRCQPNPPGSTGGSSGGGSSGCDQSQSGCTDQSGNCQSGYYWNGSSCVPQTSGGGGGGDSCGGFNDKAFYQNFAIISWLQIFTPFHFGRWC